MKYSCKIIEDLLPIYIDNVCSEESRQLVEEHLSQCSKCRTLMQSISGLQFERIDKSESEKTEIVKNGFKKIYRHWLASLIAVFMLIPIMLFTSMGINELREDGIAFSNLDDIYRCTKLLYCIKNGKYEKAAQMVVFSDNEYKLVESVADMTVEEYRQYMEDRFITKLYEYEALGISIGNIRFDSAYKREKGLWTVCMSFDEIYPDGSKQRIVAGMNGKTMITGSFSYPDKNKTERDDYIDQILHLYSEDESLWYKDYKVTFELKEGEKAVIYRNGDGTLFDGVFNITYGTDAEMVDEPYYQDVFETSVAGKYSVCAFDKDEGTTFLTTEQLNIEITAIE